MENLLDNPHHQFLKPLVAKWLGNLEGAKKARASWEEIADECLMFYSKSAAAMWNEDYGRKLWGTKGTKGVKPPKFRFSINKAFEFVAVYGPNLLWETPHRNAEPKRRLDIPPEMLPQDPMFQLMWEQLVPLQQQSEQSNYIVANLVMTWLNYTAREQPQGLLHHAEMATLDAMLTGRGVLATRPFAMPNSKHRLTGCFRIDPKDIFIDPDCTSVDDARWIAIKHIDPYHVVEERFQLPEGTMKSRSKLESVWQTSGLNSSLTTDFSMHRAQGQTNDLVVWYEIYSKTGCGARSSGMDEKVRDHLEKTVGEYAYLAICAECEYPLNCSKDQMRGMTTKQVKEQFQWPIPMFADDKWPVQFLDFYSDPESPWPIAPLAPALGELKLINFLVPWIANRIYNSARDFWAVAGPHVDHYVKYLEEGKDQTVIPTPLSVQDVRQAITVLQQPETRADIWRLLEVVFDIFDKRTGLTEAAYGRNEGGTQDRTAATTKARERAVGVRPEYMQKKVVAWQSDVAACEAAVARRFIRAADVGPLMGPAGQFLWQKFVEGKPLEEIMRELSFAVGASSVRRPNRDRDIENFQQAMTIFGPIAQMVLEKYNDPTPYNALAGKFGELHDMDTSGMLIQPPQPPQDPKAETDRQLAEMEMQGKQMDMQAKAADTQMKMALGEQKLQLEREKAALDLQKQQMEFQFDMQKGQAEMAQQEQQHEMAMRQQGQQFEQSTQQAAMSNLLKLKQMNETGDAKVQLLKKQAKAKPKTTSSK